MLFRSGAWQPAVMDKTAITNVTASARTPEQLWRREFITRERWHCYCHFGCADPRQPGTRPRALPGVTYATWLAAHSGSVYHNALIEHARAFMSYYVDAVPTQAYVHGTMRWTTGAARPLWPERCAGSSRRGASCDACAWLAGDMPRSTYNESVGFVVPPRSALLDKLNRINSGSQDSAAATNLTRGRHTASVDMARHMTVRNEILLVSNAELQRQASDASARMTSVDQELGMACDALSGVTDAMLATRADLHARESELRVAEERCAASNAMVHALSLENQMLLLDMRSALEEEEPRDLFDRAVLAMGDQGLFNVVQLEFVQNWKRRACSKHAHCGELISDLALLAYMDMPPHTYDTFKVFLGLPHIDHAVRMRNQHADFIKYSVGNCPKAYDMASKRFSRTMTVASADGTRLRRMVAYHGCGLVGRCFPPDVRDWPTQADPVPCYMRDLTKYVSCCRSEDTLLANQIITVAVQSCSGDTMFVPIMMFPETCKGFVTESNVALMLETQRLLWNAGIHCTGECDDSCSTCHGAGILLMTPRADDATARWLGLPNIPEFRYWSRLLAQGRCGDVPRTELWFSWMAERLHAERNIRIGTDRPTSILVTCILPDNTQRVAALAELKIVANLIVATDTPYSGTSLRNMYTIKQFRDQEGDAAFAFLTMSTMDIMVRTRGEASYPLLLYQLACMHILEVWVNPEFTRPYIMGAYLFTGKSLLDTFEAYVKLHGLPADMSLLSHTTRRTLDTMAHTPIHHVLKMFRKHQDGAIDLDAHWSQVAMHKINTKPLEGYHGTIRTTGNGVTPTLGEWLCLVTNMILKINLLHRLKDNYKVDIGASRNTRNEHQGKHVSFGVQPVPDSLRTLIGLAAICNTSVLRYGSPCDPAACPLQHQVAVSTYAQLVEQFEAGCRHGLDINGPLIYKTLNPEAVEQFLETNVHSFPVRKKWIRPRDMHIVRTGDYAAPVDFDLGGAAGCPRPSSPSTAQRSFAENLGTLHALCETISNISNPMGVCETVPVRAANGVVTQVPTNMAVMDNDGEWHGLNETLAVMQLQEWVSRDRGPRFWTGALPEHRALPPGHNVRHGSLLAVTWPAPVVAQQTLAIVRVTHILVGSAAPKSCTLDNKSSTVQAFRAEICVQLRGPQARGPPGGACFVATGRHYPGLLKASLVLHVVALQGCPHEVVATLEHEEYMAYTGTGAVFLDMSRLAVWKPLQDPAGGIVADAHGSEDQTCCRCTMGWWDDTTGILLQCQGLCQRFFHAECLEKPESLLLGQMHDWECNKCAGRDTEVCDACGEEWFCADTDSAFYTGEMLQCEGCHRWWHQTCHEPEVNAADLKKTKWHCASCLATRLPKKRMPALRPPASAGPRKKPAVSGTPPPQSLAPVQAGPASAQIKQPSARGMSRGASSNKRPSQHATAEPAGPRTKSARLLGVYAPPRVVAASYFVTDPWEPAHRQTEACTVVHEDPDELPVRHKCQLCLKMVDGALLQTYGPRSNKEYRCSAACMVTGAVKRTRQ